MRMTVAGTGLAAPAYGLSLLRYASDDFDFKVETGEPVDADSSPIGERWSAENSVLDLQDGLELVFGIGMKRGYINNVIESGAGCLQCRFKIIERELNLLCEVGFGRAVAAASNLTGDKQQVARADSGGITMLVIKGTAVGGENSFSSGHFRFPF